MKNKTIFAKIMTVITIALICVVLTIVLAFLLGTSNTEFFDFSKLNISNMIPVFIIGGFISCIVIGMSVIVLAKDVFIKIKDDFFKKDNGGNEK